MRGKQAMSSQNGTAHVDVPFGERLRARIIDTRKRLPEKAFHFPAWDEVDADGNVVSEGWVFMRALTAAQRGVVYNGASLPDPQPGKPNNTKVDTGRMMILIAIHGMYAALPDPDDPTNPAKMRRDEKPLFTLADYQVVSELDGAIVQDASSWVIEQSGLRQEDLDAAKNGSSPVVETTGFTLN